MSNNPNDKELNQPIRKRSSYTAMIALLTSVFTFIIIGFVIKATKYRRIEIQTYPYIITNPTIEYVKRMYTRCVDDENFKNAYFTASYLKTILEEVNNHKYLKNLFVEELKNEALFLNKKNFLKFLDMKLTNELLLYKIFRVFICSYFEKVHFDYELFENEITKLPIFTILKGKIDQNQALVLKRLLQERLIELEKLKGMLGQSSELENLEKVNEVGEGNGSASEIAAGTAENTNKTSGHDETTKADGSTNTGESQDPKDKKELTSSEGEVTQTAENIVSETQVDESTPIIAGENNNPEVTATGNKSEETTDTQKPKTDGSENKNDE